MSASAWVGPRGEQWRAHLAPMETMLAPIDEPLFRALQLSAPSRIADIGCGGGGTAIAIARRAPAGTAVHGFDVSPSLVAVARTRPDGGDVAFDVADVATAAPHAPYDRLVSRFGVMFFDDPDAAFANLARWLAPGGRFAFAVWGPVAENPWFTTVRDVVARFVDLPQSPPDAAGPFRYADLRPLVATLERAGFVDLDVSTWGGALAIGRTSDESASFALASFSSFGTMLADAGESALADAHRVLSTTLDRHRRDGVVRLGASVHIMRGARR